MLRLASGSCVKKLFNLGVKAKGKCFIMLLRIVPKEAVVIYSMSQGPPRAYAHLLITAKSITESALTIIGGKIKIARISVH